MSKAINKINNLTKVDGFIQLNYSKGFKYIDKAGEFLNHLYDKDEPNNIIDARGMIVKLDEKTQLKTSSHQLWMRFMDPDSFDSQKRSFLGKAQLINEIFGPESYTRIGWRNHLVYESAGEYPQVIPSEYLGGGDFSELVFTKEIKKFKIRISVAKLMKTDEVSSKAILFDIDIFKNVDVKKSEFEEVLQIFSEIESIYNSKELLIVINTILK